MNANKTTRTNGLSDLLINKRRKDRIGVIPFINCGDPNLDATRSLLSVCDKSQVAAVELGVPFANSVTDGVSILKSHERALLQKIQYEDVLEIVRDFRRESALPIYIIAEFGHTVRQRGIKAVLTQAEAVNVNGFLMHCLPPLLLREYLDTAKDIGIDTVLGLFPNSRNEQIQFVVSEATGLIYLASSYSKTGKSIGFTPSTLSFFKSIRKLAKQPLAVGFGIETRNDLKTIHNCGVDAGIIGSAITAIIERNIDDSEKMKAEVGNYLNELQS